MAPSLCSLHHHPHLLIFLSTLHSSANTKIQSTQIQKIHSTQIHSKQIQNTQLTNTKHITLQPHHHPHLIFQFPANPSLLPPPQIQKYTSAKQLPVEVCHLCYVYNPQQSSYKFICNVTHILKRGQGHKK